VKAQRNKTTQYENSKGEPHEKTLTLLIVFQWDIINEQKTMIKFVGDKKYFRLK
jgi:hypothetical protein